MAACILIAFVGCDSSSDPNEGENPNPTRVSFPLEGAVSGVQLQAGVPQDLMFTLQMPPEMESVQGVELDIEGTLMHGELTDVSVLSLLSRAGEPPTAVAYMRVGTDTATVCSEGIAYGPFNVSQSTSLEVNPPTATADSATVQIINTGSVVICMNITTNFDATFSLDSLEVDVTQEDCATPAAFAGTWSGTYQCSDGCSGKPFGGKIELVVTQNGTSASYSDGDDVYTGTICGNLFRFERHDEFEIERGTMTLTDANHAIKRSTWRLTNPPYCSGNCEDVLTRAAMP
jgi:hypothetical protein